MKIIIFVINLLDKPIITKEILLNHFWFCQSGFDLSFENRINSMYNNNNNINNNKDDKYIPYLLKSAMNEWNKMKQEICEKEQAHSNVCNVYNCYCTINDICNLKPSLKRRIKLVLMKWLFKVADYIIDKYIDPR